MFLLNITTGARYECTIEEWHGLLDLAGDNGWDPLGTVLDLAFQLFIHPEPNYLFESQLFVTLYLHNYCLAWNGDYRNPEHQLVRDDDCANMLEALVYAQVDPAFLEFIGGGSFRICP